MNFESAMKSSVVQYWKGHTELDQDNALLVSKYIILKANFISPNAEISLINDYIGDRYNEERIIVSNIQKALHYLTK